MYRPRAFAVDDIAILHDVIAARIFATIAMAQADGVAFAYAPVLLDAAKGPKGTLRFHVASANRMAGADGSRLFFSFMAEDGYISPDWYANTAAVPTWNYIAVEAHGMARKLDEEELRQQVIDLSAQEEEKLRTKRPWTLDKVPEDKVEALLRAITGFEVPLDSLEGKFKLSQNKLPEDIAGAIAGLEARGDAASLGLARAMREMAK